MQALTLNTILSLFGSERVKNAVVSASFFGAAGALRGAAARFEGFTRTIRQIEDRYPERAEKMRSGNTFSELEKRLEAAANKAAGIHALAEQHGVLLRVEFEPPIAKPLTKVEIENLATLTQLPKELIQKTREDADKRRYDSEMEASALAASAFWTAVADSDVMVKFESVARAIERTRLNILTWSRPDLTELACIAADERILDGLEATHSDDPAQFFEDEAITAEREAMEERKALDAHAKRLAQAAKERARDEADMEVYEKTQAERLAKEAEAAKAAEKAAKPAKPKRTRAPKTIAEHLTPLVH